MCMWMGAVLEELGFREHGTHGRSPKGSTCLSGRVLCPSHAPTRLCLLGQVLGIVDDAFMAGAQRHTVKLVMKRLKATQGRLREDLKPKAKVRAHLLGARRVDG